ncbi:hypothetical protein OUZ56_008936 [Daphnia magna]|uniref:Uncharacterized protein n=1 Tax=Daphnia magna TaxID=35525 RepID=A0ABR0AEJ9_9CRUS|nr:hypothetical protein OUZ56_008936 [Daphnia magna]
MIAGGLCRSNFCVHRPVGISPDLIDKEKIVTYGVDEALIESEKQPNTDTDAMRQILFSILILSLLIALNYLLLVREFALATRMSMAQRDACETDKTLNGQVEVGLSDFESS